MAYRQVSVTSGTPVDVQPTSDTRPYVRALLSVEGGTVRLVSDGQDPTTTFGTQVFAGERNFAIRGVGEVRNSKLIAQATTATVGINLLTEDER